MNKYIAKEIFALTHKRRGLFVKTSINHVFSSF